MTKLILEVSSEAEALVEGFASEHPDQTDLREIHGSNAADLLSLVIEHSPALTASLAALIASLRGQGLKFKLTRDGAEIDIGALAKPE